MMDASTSEKRLERNLVADFLGQVTPASMGILFVPGCVRISEIEAYGLIVFYTLIQMFLTLLEMGALSGARPSYGPFHGGEH